MFDRLLLLRFILNCKLTNHEDDNRQLYSVQWWIVLRGICFKAISKPYQLETKYKLDNYFIIRTLTCFNMPRYFCYLFVISNFLWCDFTEIELYELSKTLKKRFEIYWKGHRFAKAAPTCREKNDNMTKLLFTNWIQ